MCNTVYKKELVLIFQQAYKCIIHVLHAIHIMETVFRLFVCLFACFLCVCSFIIMYMYAPVTGGTIRAHGFVITTIISTVSTIWCGGGEIMQIFLEVDGILSVRRDRGREREGYHNNCALVHE